MFVFEGTPFSASMAAIGGLLSSTRPTLQPALLDPEARLGFREIEALGSWGPRVVEFGV